MKKTMKKLIALLLATLMLVSSAPLTAFADDELVSLQNAIIAYEAKMNGSVYTNMKPAYTAYVKAKEGEYAYKYGRNNSVDLAGLADTLASATDAMTAWTGLVVESPNFIYGSDVPGTYVRNVLYASTPEVYGGMRVEAFSFKFVMPKNAVLLYDGGDIKVPVMVAIQNNGMAVAGNDRAPLSFFANDNTADTLNDNEYFQLEQQWKGYYEIEKDGGPTAVNEYNWENAMAGEDKIPGYNNQTNSETSIDNRGEKINTGNQKKWRQYANWLSYQTSAASKTWDNRLQSVTLSWTGRNIRWTSVFGSTAMDYHYYYSSGDGDNRFGADFYVVDYRGANEAMTAAASSYLDIDDNYKKYELNGIFDAFDYLQNSVTEGFTSTNYVEKAREIAIGITDSIAALNAGVSEKDFSSYTALAQTLDNCKAVYNANNSDGTYTAESFAAFKTAYESSMAEASAVYANGFTTATTASELEAKFKALNKVTKPNGTSGEATYTYDEETGVVTVTGPGAMGDYESGEDSPFGNTDKITEIVISDDVTYIGSNAFKGCNNLTKITVPATATYGKGAFDDCTSLKEVIIVKGEVKNASAKNAPWKQPSVNILRLGADENDMSVTGIGDTVFVSSGNTSFYFYNPECDIPNNNNSTLGNNPTIHGYIPSNAYYYAEKFNYVQHNFVSLGHEHVMIVDHVVDPTCTKGGYTVYKCKYDNVCSYTNNADFVSPLGHNYDAGVVTAPTCTEKGYTTKTCSVCGFSKKESYVSALGHDFSGAYSPNYASPSMKNDSTVYTHSTTCTRTECDVKETDYCTFVVDGSEVVGGQNCIKFRCSVCNGVYYYPTQAQEGEFNVFFFDVDNQLLKVISVASGQRPSAALVPALREDTDGVKYSWQLDGVDYEPTEKAITDTTVFKMVATSESYTVTYYDKYKDELVSTEIVEYGKSPANVPDLKSDVIRQTDGHLVYAWENDADPKTAVITSTTTFNMNCVLVEHNFTDTVLDEPTCTEKGSMSRFCNDCEYSITGVEIPALGHDIVIIPAVPATCTAGGMSEGSYCSRCEEYERVVPVPVNATGHKWDVGKVTVQPTVTTTGTKVYTCKVCKTTKTETLPKATVQEVTPTDKEANAAPVNKTINRPKKVRTTSLSKKKQLRVRFDAIAGALNYRVQYRSAGAKKWSYAWTDGKTEYYLKNLKANGLYEFRFAAYKKNSSGKWERGNYSKITRRYYYKHAVKSAKPGKGMITVKWKNKKGATSYQLQYSAKKNMKGAKTINISNPKTLSYVIKGLKKGKTYYVRVRANKKVNKKTYTGEYSKRIKVKVK